jgi:hypothetical protein
MKEIIQTMALTLALTTGVIIAFILCLKLFINLIAE